MPRKSGKNTPTIISGTMYTDDDWNGLQVGSDEWSIYLEDGQTFYYDHPTGAFSAQKQHHRHGYFWYAYKRINGKLYKKYLGMRETIDADRLLQVAGQYAEIAKSGQFASQK